MFSSRLVWLPLIRASHVPASRIDISRTERQKNEGKKRLFCSLIFSDIRHFYASRYRYSDVIVGKMTYSS